MTLLLEKYLIASTLLVLLAIFASKLTGRWAFVSLLVFFIFGVILANKSLLSFSLRHPFQLELASIISLAFMAFSVGQNLNFHSLRGHLLRGLLHGIFIPLITLTLFTLFSVTFSLFSFEDALLIGVILAALDPVLYIMTHRARRVDVNKTTSSLLQIESAISISFSFFLLTMVAVKIQTPTSLPIELVGQFLIQGIVSFFLGGICGLLLVKILNMLKLGFDGLYPIFSLAIVLLVYAVAQGTGGSGIMTVLVMGAILGNRRHLHKKSLILFHDGVAWLFQIFVFLLAGLMLDVDHFFHHLPLYLLSSILILLIIRPLILLIFFKSSLLSFKERVAALFLTPKGAAPLVLALFPSVWGLEIAPHLLPLALTITLLSFSLNALYPLVTKTLGISQVLKKVKARFPVEYLPKDNLKQDLYQFQLHSKLEVVGKQIVEVPLPETAILLLIEREGRIIIPRGSTQLEVGDSLLCLAEKDVLPELVSVFGESQNYER